MCSVFENIHGVQCTAIICRLDENNTYFGKISNSMKLMGNWFSHLKFHYYK
ncbi:hypothetical protein BDA96_08G203600 [Sorghum bicolor]|uniref:Uncharacterized protein n=1 Tax=Sorghum bicolor TaxID=4558 RepID=A0A921U7Q7_SORBI|nr:hypothetical protein BDA96_08G203600 [Sorghum bicolor]